IAEERLYSVQPTLKRAAWISVLFAVVWLGPPVAVIWAFGLDDVFSRMSSNFTNLQYYFKYVTNSLGRMSQFRLDEVFVYLVRNYIQAGKAPGTKSEEMQKIVNDATRMEPLFVGKKASNLVLFDRQNQPVTLYAQTAPMILLVFWQPDCSHCKREMPLLKNISERYKNKGLKVMAVCGKSGDEAADCWKFQDEQALPADWLVLADPPRRSGMANLFNLRTFPRIFLLDENKNIVWKRAGEASEMEMEAALGKLGAGR
ncbi:MAG: TlpA disulfide reductase family protein, partial [Bacteroidota bacterium]